MQQQLLDLVERHFQADSPISDTEKWAQLVPVLGDHFIHVTDRLFHALRMATPGRMLEESITEHLVTRRPGVVICEARLRPVSRYYEAMARAIPTPENPAGPDATGIAISVLLCRGFPGNAEYKHAHIAIELDVWGGYERELFRELMRDHHHSMSALLASKRLKLQTACCFDNVDAVAKAPAFNKLQLYCENDNDPENSFTIGHQVNLGDSEADALTALLQLAAVYDTAMGYYLQRQDRARIYDYLELIRRT